MHSPDATIMRAAEGRASAGRYTSGADKAILDAAGHGRPIHKLSGCAFAIAQPLEIVSKALFRNSMEARRFVRSRKTCTVNGETRILSNDVRGEELKWRLL